MIRKLFLLLIFMTANFNAQDLRKIIDLRGDWFFNLGDDINWSKENLNTNKWDEIKVPSTWEDQGYNGYDGYAWFRKTFNLYPRFTNSSLLFRLGRIDDVSQIFLNGKQIGIIGSFPPRYSTAYAQWIEIHIPKELFKVNQVNTIAIRVYDAELSGGIIDGEISIYENNDELPLELNLAGEWKFITVDNEKFKLLDINDSEWNSIIVPGKWESQGFAEYDGIAWYRKTFTISKKSKDKKLVIVLGKIDDIDEVYLNGKLIGSTGDFNKLRDFNKQNQWQKLRSYFIIDNSIINFDKENLISVRVYDGFQDRGIYEGPIGIAEQSAFTKYWKKIQQRENRNSNNWFLDWLFD